MPVNESTMWGGIYATVLAIYTGITGHIYTRIGSLDRKIEKNRDHTEEAYVSKDTFEAHMDAVQQANVATAKFADKSASDSAKANLELFRLINTKQDKS